MITQQETGIKENVINEIADIANRCQVDRVVLFGSRARGDFKERSDIDLAFWGGSATDFILAVDEETDTLLMFDIVDMSCCRDEALRESIERDGRTIYEKV